MVYGIRVWAFADGTPVPRPGEWLRWFDYDASDEGNDYPTGNGDTTPNPAEAFPFATVEQAWEAWKRPSQKTPRRPDGKPNRPMTALTIEVSPLPISEGGVGEVDR